MATAKATAAKATTKTTAKAATKPANDAASAAKALNNTSKQIGKDAKAFGRRIHTHLIAIAKHVLAHRDATVGGVFLKEMMDVDKEGNSRSVVRSEAIKNWLEAFGFCKWVKDGDKQVMKINKKMLDAVSGNLDETRKHFKEANATPWNKLTPEKPFNGFDLDAALKAVLTRAEAADKKARDYALEHGLPEGYETVDEFVADKVKMPTEHMAALKKIVS